jgi:hypothetical protein
MIHSKYRFVFDQFNLNTTDHQIYNPATAKPGFAVGLPLQLPEQLILTLNIKTDYDWSFFY